MNNKKRYQKIYVNGDCVVDFTEQNITAEDVAEGKIFYDTSGKLQTGTLQPKTTVASSDWYYSDGPADINVRGTSLSRHCFFYDNISCGECGTWGNSYNLYLDKDSYISSDSWYSSGTNYMWFTLYCDEDMSWEDLWSCISFSTDLNHSSGHFPSGLCEIYFGNEQPTDMRFPDTYCIPQYFFQLWSGSFNTVTVPEGVQEIHGDNYFSCDDLIFEGTEPPIIGSTNVLDSCTRIIVPNGSKQNYINAENWSDKAEIIFEQSEVLS